MPIIVTTNRTGAGPLVDLAATSGDFAVVSTGVIVATTSGTSAISGTGSGQSVVVHGLVIADGGPGVRLSGANATLTVGASGVVETIEPLGSGSGTAVVYLPGSFAAVSNAGLIRGDWAVGASGTLDLNNSGVIEGFDFEAVSASVAASIRNSGTLMTNGGQYCVDVASLTMVNTGTIIGAIRSSSTVADDRVTNAGLITDTIDLGGGNDVYDGRLGRLGGAGAALGEEGNDTLRGGDFEDLLNGGDNDDLIRGGRNDDWLLGENGQDSLNAGDGDDTLDGGAGQDNLSGGRGDDLIAGLDDADEVLGGEGADTVTGGLGDDLVRGGYGDDQAAGEAGNDTLYGNAGDDNLSGGDDNDQLFGGDGRDTLGGSAGNDALNGGDQDDILSGSSGNDTVIGGDGIDRLTGGSGGDRLSGGNGADVFVYDAAGDSSGVNFDRISEFSTSGGDVIDLADVSTQVMAFVGTAAFSGGGVASVRVVNISSTQRQVLVDTDGNGSVNMRIDLDGALTFTAGDFIL